jgi:hypothetical protein
MIYKVIDIDYKHDQLEKINSLRGLYPFNPATHVCACPMLGPSFS